VYPPEPWDLRGQLYLSVFAVPGAALPALPAPLAAAVGPVLIGGRALVGAAWVRYEPGGTLDYRELLSAVLVLQRYRPRVSILDIWVDSPASRDGGRALWGIPKELAEFVLTTDTGGTTAAVATTAGGEIAKTTVTRGIRIPGRWPAPLSVVQALGDRVRHTRVRGWAGLRLSRATWHADPAGPLGYLAGRRPLLTATLADFRLRFGSNQPGNPSM
jgi:hypothetical protein